MRCTNCGHQGSPGATFCLNCGTQLETSGAVPVPLGAGGTYQASGGLPSSLQSPAPASKSCMRCQADNALNMKFCRQCGTPLGTVPTPVPPAASGPVHQAAAAIPSTLVSDEGAGAPAPATNAAPAAPIIPARSRPATPTPPPGSLPRAGVGQPAQGRAPVRCPTCGGDTPSGFTFCQRCGKPLASTSAPSTAPAGSAQAASTSAPSTAPAGSAQAASTSAPSTAPPGSAQAPSTSAPSTAPAGPAPSTEAKRPTHDVSGPRWATLICVNRDGSDGAVHDLRGDYVEIGSDPAVAIQFDDPYLAPRHARIERHGTGGARIVPLDKLNGVFHRLRKDTTLVHGAVVLMGRELVRFELLSAEESMPGPLRQHGVTLFGSPVRETWGRLLQIVPSAGVRDVRHLCGDEVVVGREVGDIVFGDDEFLSRRHAAFRWKNSQCVLSDLGSSNGTFLRLAEPSNLSDGDFLRIGDQMFRFKPE